MAKVLTDAMRARSAGDDPFGQSAARRIRPEISEGAIVKQSYDIDDLGNAFENLEFPTVPRSTWACIESGVLKQLARPRLEPTPRPRRRDPRAVAVAVAVPGPLIPPDVAGPGYCYRYYHYYYCDMCIDIRIHIPNAILIRIVPNVIVIIIIIIVFLLLILLLRLLSS